MKYLWVPPRIWEGGDCWILGGGPSVVEQFRIPDDVVAAVRMGKRPVSAYSDYMSCLHDKHVIGINNAYLLGTWVDILFFGDCSWYLVHRLALATWHKVKVTCCPRFNKPRGEREGVHYMEKDPGKRFGISTNPGKVAWNNNSGAAAISLGVQLGASRIFLLGFDMDVVHGHSHWHGGHGAKRPPHFPRHLKGFPDIARDATSLGVEIINVSPRSAIVDLRKAVLSDVLPI